MNFLRLYKRNIRMGIFSRWLSVFLLSLYGFILVSPAAHEWTHHVHEDEELHNTRNELDPCHQAIYHHDNNACRHEAHVSESEKCWFCDVHFLSECLAIFSIDNFILSNDDVHRDLYSEPTLLVSDHCSYRGPPVQ